MGKRRSSEVELCFDSMTDLITNLAGGLILLVLLLLGLTREAPAPAAAAPEPAAEGKKGSEKSAVPLLEQVNQLRAASERVDKDVSLLQERMRELRKDAHELL